MVELKSNSSQTMSAPPQPKIVKAPRTAPGVSLANVVDMRVEDHLALVVQHFIEVYD